MLSPHLLKPYLLKTLASSEKLQEVVPISFLALCTPQCVSPHICSHAPAQTSNMRHQGNRPGISQTTNLMPISGCDKVRPMNSASHLQFFLLHAATLPSRSTCYRQVPRGDWQHRPEGPHPQRMSSWGDPSTDISDISASKLQ